MVRWSKSLKIAVILLSLSAVQVWAADQCERATSTAQAYQDLAVRVVRAPRVTAPVAGLYESIPATIETAAGGMAIDTDIQVKPDGARSFHTTVFSQTESGNALTGSIDRIVRGQTLILQQVSLRGPNGVTPSFIQVPGTVPLVPGRGIPTHIFVTLQQMRLAGVLFGGLTRIEASNITNLESTLEIFRSQAVQEFLRGNPGVRRFPREVVEAAFRETETFRYIETLATQSGHRIIRIELMNEKYLPQSFARIRDQRMRARDPNLSAILNSEGPIPADDQMLPWSYSMRFHLEPLR